MVSIFELRLGGLAGLSVGSLAVSAYAGSVSQVVVEAVGIIISVVSAFWYIVMQYDRYSRASTR